MSSLDESYCEIVQVVPSKLRERAKKSPTTIIILDNSSSSTDKTPPPPAPAPTTTTVKNQEFRFRPYQPPVADTHVAKVEVNKKESPNLKISVNQQTPSRKIDGKLCVKDKDLIHFNIFFL